jgi:SAM-dependent methyltransferase
MKLVNETRRSPSIPRRLAGEGRLHLLPLYYLVRLSDLGREGIEHSGSHRFADHIYVGTARGRLAIGTLVDRLLLSLPATRSFRNRFVHCRDVIRDRLLASSRPVRRVLSVPCGIPRELVEAARAVRREQPGALAGTTFSCMDINPAALAEARALVAEVGLTNFEMIEADALDGRAYPDEVDIVTSTGFAEFLTDEQAERFYGLCLQSLRPGGTLVTAATVRNAAADYLLRHVAELLAHYRHEDALRAMLERAGFSRICLRRDRVGYQVLATADKLL